MLIDAHCHLDNAAFDPDRDAVLARARHAGVDQLVVAGTHRQGWRATLQQSHHDRVHVCLGLHPVFLAHHHLSGGDDDLAALARALDQHPECVALGECGIDARFGDTLEQQWRLFDAQLALAKERDLPVVVHCVRANDEVAKRLRQLALPAGGVIHAFSGSAQQASRFLDLGFVVGLGGAVTYPRAARLRRAVVSLPDDGFLLESDSPDMPLCGHQGQRNEPARVAQVCDCVAELRRQTIERVADCSRANARRLFRLPPG